MTTPETIRLGSKGEPVKKWQEFLKITADGIFGPQTQQATIAYQTKNKLVPDGVVGPATWSHALGKDFKPAPTPNNPFDKQAYEISVRAAPNMPEVQRQYALTVARGEGFYGRGWKEGPGKGSNNWGAVQGVGSAGSFQTTDHHADGSAYMGRFKRYNTPEEGFNDMARILFNGGKRGELGAKEIKNALAMGNLKKAVYAQHANGYYELDPAKYYAAMAKNYATITANLGWPNLLGRGFFGKIGAQLGEFIKFLLNKKE